MNLLIITGNVVKDAELRYTPSQKQVLNFTVANNQGYGENQRTEYYDCAIWGKRAESLAPYIRKGDKLTIHGEHSTDKSESNGKTYFRNRVFVREVELGSNPNSSQSPTQGRASYDSAKSGVAPAADFDDDMPY